MDLGWIWHGFLMDFLWIWDEFKIDINCWIYPASGAEGAAPPRPPPAIVHSASEFLSSFRQQEARWRERRFAALEIILDSEV